MMSSRGAGPALLTVALTLASGAAAAAEPPPSHVLLRGQLLALDLGGAINWPQLRDPTQVEPDPGPGVALQVETAPSAAVALRLDLACARFDADVTWWPYGGWYGSRRYQESFTFTQVGIGARFRLASRPGWTLHLTPLALFQMVDSSSGYRTDELFGGPAIGVELGADFRPRPQSPWFWTVAARAFSVATTDHGEPSTAGQLAAGAGRTF